MDNFRIANCNAANFNYPGVRYAGRAGKTGRRCRRPITTTRWRGCRG